MYTQIPINFIVLVLASVSGIVQLYFLSAVLLRLFIPELRVPINDIIFTLTNRQLSSFLGLTIIAQIICILLRIKQKRMVWQRFKISQSYESLIFLMTSLYLANFFAGSLNFFPGMYQIGLILFFVFFMFVLPNISKFYNKLGYFAQPKLGRSSDLNSPSKKLQRNMKIKSIFFGIVITVVMLIFMVVIAGIIFKSYEYTVKLHKLKSSLYIDKIKPSKSIVGEKIDLHGYNFGWRNNKQDRLMSDYGPVMVETWTEEKLDFKVPFNWQDGKVKIWIERHKTDSPPFEKYKSNTVIFNLKSRWEYYPNEKEFFDDSLPSLVIKGFKKIRRKIELNID